MSKSLYNKKIEGRCAYCANARLSSALNIIFCKYKGPVNGEGFCRKYKYDPLKRFPKTMANLPTYSKDDFDL